MARFEILHPSSIETGGKSLTFLPHSDRRVDVAGTRSRRAAPTAPERTSWEAAR